MMENSPKTFKPRPMPRRRIVDHCRRWSFRAARGAALMLSLYVIAAYVVLPAAWQCFTRGSSPSRASGSAMSLNKLGLPSDPVNLAFVGTREQVIAAMTAAGWQLADPVNFVNGLKTVYNIVLQSDYPTAPMSMLYLQGRSQDLAFQQANGSPRQRHHVRMWLSDQAFSDGRPLWLCAATFDTGIRFCLFTGRLTHRIGPDLDVERDKVVADLMHAGVLGQIQSVYGIGPTVNGSNGSGDRYFTDGQTTIAVLADKPPKSLSK